MKMIDHNHFICHLILGTFTEYPELIDYTFDTDRWKRCFLYPFTDYILAEAILLSRHPAHSWQVPPSHPHPE